MRSATAVSNDLLIHYLNAGANIPKPDVTPRLWLVDVVELTVLDRFPVPAGFGTPPVDP